MTAQCLVCDATLSIDKNVEVSEIITCMECQNKLEVKAKDVELKTVQLIEAPKVEEDWGE